MTSNLPPTSERDLKKSVQDFLTIQEAQGKLFWLRLNAGMLISEYKGKRRAISLGRPGTADYQVLQKQRGYLPPEGGWPIPRHRTIFLELKAPKGRQSQAQKDFQKAVESQGAVYWVIRDVEELQRRLGNGR